MKFILLLFLLFSVINASSQSYNRGENLFFTKVCNGCHGPDAEGGGIYPRLANKDKKYLIERLEYFKKGVVNTQNQEMMVQFILNFSQEEIEDMATFLSEHKKNETPAMDEDIFGGYGS